MYNRITLQELAHLEGWSKSLFKPIDEVLYLNRLYLKVVRKDQIFLSTVYRYQAFAAVPLKLAGRWILRHLCSLL
jgi:hypothetical protein